MKVKTTDGQGKNKMIKSVRSWHRDIGFFVIGLTLIYALSGIVLLFRDTDFLKQEKQVTRSIEPGKQESELGAVLRMRDFKVTKTDGDLLYFDTGFYNQKTGELEYVSKELPAFLQKITGLHKAISGNKSFWINLIYGFLLLFMALSAPFMFKSRTKMLRRGIYISAAGFVFVLIYLLL
ncbi:hypothetical protein [uncultured Draconibacterium sp.]|uniref:hypothetical protein n=2 Tax=uncultured Draconibacterium sp. TaxID=1573823 RepID=UPI003217CB2C